MAEKLHAITMGRPAENFALLHKIRIFSRIIYSVGPCSALVAEKYPGVMAIRLIPFCSTFTLDEISDLVCRYVEPLPSYALPTGGPRKLRFFPRQFF